MPRKKVSLWVDEQSNKTLDALANEFDQNKGVVADAAVMMLAAAEAQVQAEYLRRAATMGIDRRLGEPRSKRGKRSA